MRNSFLQYIRTVHRPCVFYSHTPQQVSQDSARTQPGLSPGSRNRDRFLITEVLLYSSRFFSYCRIHQINIPIQMQCRQPTFADQYKGGFLLNPISRSTLSNSGKTSIIERGSQSSLVLCGRYSLSKVLRHHPNVCSASQDCECQGYNRRRTILQFVQTL